MAVTRTLTLDDLSPAEVAELFCDMNSSDQAEFFNAVAEIARSWPGAGWCQQACEIIRSKDLDDRGRRAIGSLAEHLELAKQEA